MNLHPTRVTLRVEAPPQGLSGADALRSLFYGLRGLGNRLAIVSVYGGSFSPEAGLHTITKRNHGRAPHKIDLWPGYSGEDKWQRRGHLVQAAATAVALLTGHSEDHSPVIARSDVMGLGTIWPLLTDIKLDTLQEVGGKVTAMVYQRWLDSIGMGAASLMEVEAKLRIGRATGSLMKQGKMTMSSVLKWAKVGGYKGDYTDLVEEFWPNNTEVDRGL